MNRWTNRSITSRHCAFSLVELVTASAVLLALLAGLLTAFSVVNRSMALAKGYALGKLTLSDYIAMDVRRSQVDLARCGIAANPPTSTAFTLPLALVQDEYFSTDNRTPREPVRVVLATGQLKKDRQKIVMSSYAFGYRWDATKGFLPHYITYYLSGTAVFRREEGYNTAVPPALVTLSDRRIATDVQSINFTSDDIIVGSAASSSYLSALKFQVNFVPNFFSKAKSNPVGTPGQTNLFNQVFIRSGSYGSPLPVHP